MKDCRRSAQREGSTGEAIAQTCFDVRASPSRGVTSCSGLRTLAVTWSLNADSVFLIWKGEVQCMLAGLVLLGLLENAD